MTEAEWLTGTEPDPMLAFLWRKASDRKLRLFACGCCRELWESLEDERSRNAVATAEHYADGIATDGTRRGARHAAQVARSEASRAARQIARAAYEATHHDAWEAAHYAHVYCHTLGLAYQADLLRDIFGNPFGPVAFSPDWRTDTALSLARQMYASREFGAMPILADAIQDAGCDNDDILNHCRSAGPHARGCWVIDALRKA